MLLLRPFLPPFCVSTELLYRVSSLEESFLSGSYLKSRLAAHLRD